MRWTFTVKSAPCHWLEITTWFKPVKSLTKVSCGHGSVYGNAINSPKKPTTCFPEITFLYKTSFLSLFLDPSLSLSLLLWWMVWISVTDRLTADWCFTGQLQRDRYPAAPHWHICKMSRSVRSPADSRPAWCQWDETHIAKLLVCTAQEVAVCPCVCERETLSICTANNPFPTNVMSCTCTQHTL